MKRKPERNLKRSTVNALGSIGYFFGFLEWFWAIMLYFSVLKAFTLFVSPSVDQPVGQHATFAFTPPSPIEGIIIAVITVAMVLLSIYVLIKMPSNVIKTSNKVVHKASDAVVPMVIKAQHKTDTKKNRRLLSARIISIMKRLLVLIPTGFIVGSGLLDKQAIDYSIALVVGCMLALLSLFFFAAQYILARLLHIEMADIW